VLLAVLALVEGAVVVAHQRGDVARGQLDAVRELDLLRHELGDLGVNLAAGRLERLCRVIGGVLVLAALVAWIARLAAVGGRQGRRRAAAAAFDERLHRARGLVRGVLAGVRPAAVDLVLAGATPPRACATSWLMTSIECASSMRSLMPSPSEICEPIEWASAPRERFFWLSPRATVRPRNERPKLAPRRRSPAR